MTLLDPVVDPQIVDRLAAQGVPLEVIATALQVSPSSLTVRRTRLIPEDEQLANAQRELAWRVWAECMQILENGHPADKMAIIRTVLSKTAGLIGAESTSTQQESQEAIARIFSSMRTLAPDHSPPAIPDTYDT